MKKILHLTITESLPATAQSIVAAQQSGDLAEVETLQLTTQNAPEVLEKIFAADSICVWPGKTNSN